MHVYCASLEPFILDARQWSALHVWRRVVRLCRCEGSRVLRWTRRRWLWSPAAICAAMACEQVLSSILQSYTLPLQEEEQEASRRITAYHGVSRSLLWQSAVWHLTPSQAARQAKDSAGPTRNEPRRKVKHRGFTCMQVMRALSLTATTSLSFFR